MKQKAKGLGLAIIGAGRVGLFRGEVAARHRRSIGSASRKKIRTAPARLPRRSAPIS